MENLLKCKVCGRAEDLRYVANVPYCKACLERIFYDLSTVGNVRYIIEESCVRIVTTNTVLVSCYAYNSVKQKDLFDLYSSIIKLCNEYGIKIQYKNHYKRYIRTIWSDYETIVKTAKEQYIKIVRQAVKVKNSGTHECYENDVELKNLLNMQFKYLELFNKDTAIAKIDKLQCHLLTLKRRLQNFEYDSKIKCVSL